MEFGDFYLVVWLAELKDVDIFMQMMCSNRNLQLGQAFHTVLHRSAQ